MQLALNSDYDFKYFVLLSGVCYPIKSNQYIINFFQKNNDNYIDIRTIKEKYQKYKFIYSRIIHEVYHYKKILLLLNFKKHHLYYTNFFKKQFHIARGHSWYLRGVLKRDPRYKCNRVYWYILYILFAFLCILPQKKEPKNIKNFYHGSSWWCLRKESIEIIIRFLHNKENKDAIFFYKFSECSDERIFHTILANTKENLQYEIIKNNQTYTTKDKKTGQWPRILDIEDYSELKKCPKLFARKFDFQKSKKLKSILKKI